MEIIKNNFVIITGGPGGGKTTLLNHLRGHGFDYVGETARGIIRERLDKGLSPRPAPAEFAKQMFEVDIANYNKHTGKAGILFFDRSFLDSAAMIRETDSAYFDEIKEMLHTHRFHLKVFITTPWKEIYQNDNERDQTFEEALHVYESLYDWYQLHGYAIIKLPEVSIEERAEFILNEIDSAK